MPQGLQVFNASGDVILDTTMGVCSFLGTLTISSAGTGTITNANLSKGRPWYIVNEPDMVGLRTTVTVSGNTLTHTTVNYGTVTGPVKLIYGVY